MIEAQTPRIILGWISQCVYWKVFCSFVQVYNENLYDLLRDPGKTTALTVHEEAACPRGARYHY